MFGLCSRPSFAKLLDSRVRQPNGREGEHVDFAGAEGGFGLVLLFRHVPVLNDARAADRRQADGLMVLDAGGFSHLADEAIHKNVKAVTTSKQTLPSDHGRSRLIALLGSAVGRKECQRMAYQHREEQSHDSHVKTGSTVFSHQAISAT